MEVAWFAPLINLSYTGTSGHIFGGVIKLLTVTTLLLAQDLPALPTGHLAPQEPSELP